MDNKELKEIEIILASKKYSFSEKQLFLAGSVSKTIYSTNLFPRNSDLNKYIRFFEKKLNNGEEFKEYLYSSRTLLAARVVRLVFSEKDVKAQKEIMEFHIDFLSHLLFVKKDNEDQKTKSFNKSNSLLSDMINKK